MLKIKPLVSATFTDISKVFNQSFADYYFSAHLTAKQFGVKFASENGVFELSVGAYDGDYLVGFILHFYDKIDGKKVIYNGGTGVIPKFRGQGLTRRMYDFILPILSERRIDRMVHEVLSINAPAIRVYEKVGFKQVRSLDCYKGELALVDAPSTYEIKEIKTYDWDNFQSFWDYPPTWQNSKLAMNHLQESNVALGIYHGTKLLGYLIYNPSSYRIHQFAIHKQYRYKGLASRLLYELSIRAEGKIVSMINIDSRLTYMKSLLEKCGMECFMIQYEMELKL